MRRFQRVRLGDATSTFSITHLIAPLPPPPKKNSIGIVFNCNTQEKWKTKVMQNFGGSNKVHSSGKCGSGVYVKCIDREGWGNAVQGLGKGRPKSASDSSHEQFDVWPKPLVCHQLKYIILQFEFPSKTSLDRWKNPLVLRALGHGFLAAARCTSDNISKKLFIIHEKLKLIFNM